MPAPPARTGLHLTAGLLAAAASAWAGAQGASPASADCRRAWAALEAQESRLVAARTGRAAATPAASATTSAASAASAAWSAPSVDELKVLRAAAARACLGGTGQAPPATARLMPPAAMARPAHNAPIPSSTPTPAWRPSPLPAQVPAPASPMPPPPPVERPVVITHCDPAGCWANDGTWRPRVGATLGGPRGLCTTQGALVSCP